MRVVDTKSYTHHPAIEELSELLSRKIQKNDKAYFRAIVAFFLAKMASNMRATVSSPSTGTVPVNVFTLALAESGYGKTYSVTLMERVLEGFTDRFKNETLPFKVGKTLEQRAQLRAARQHTEEDAELEGYKKQYESLGEFAFEFSEGTAAAVKQVHEKLVLGDCGAITLQMDEVGSNLLNNTEILNVFLELYDLGITKAKLTKNTRDNTRGEQIDGKVPTNALLFGTPSKLFDNGGTVEQQFYSFLETGYARRFLFAFGKDNGKNAFDELPPEELYDRLISSSNDQIFSTWKNKFYTLADPALLDWQISVPREIGIEIIRYRQACKKVADELPQAESIRKAEITHRYFRVTKLAGLFAFIDKSPEITLEHLHQAIKLTEESGEDCDRILTQEKAYARLAKYIAEQKQEVTHADLVEKLPFYTASKSSRKELMDLARSWGIKNNILIKTVVNDGIEFFTADTLQKTDMNKLLVSASDDMAYHYQDMEVSWEDICTMGNQFLPETDENPLPVHWINHRVRDGHRCEECVVPGFNLIVLDVDGTLPIKAFQKMFKDYKYALYTTKRSTEDCERYRVIFPTNFFLELDKDDYKEFMNNVLSWVPFTVDSAVNQRAHKWLTNPNAMLFTNEGKVFDVLPFIPHTKRNEVFLEREGKYTNLGALERWFSRQFAEGNRNNILFKYAMVLMDSGKDLMEIERCVNSFNNAQENKLSKEEISDTIMVEVYKRQAA